MLTRTKAIIWIAAVVVALAATAWLYDLYKQNQNLKQDRQILELKKLAAETAWTRTREELNHANSIVAEFKKRKPATRTETVIERIPPDCQSCIDNYHLPVSINDRDGLWEFSSPDIFREPGELKLTDLFDQQVVQPWRDALADCEKGRGIHPKSPLRFVNQIEARAGLTPWGYAGEASWWPVEFGGSRFTIQAGAWVGVDTDVLDYDLNAGLGVRVRIGK